ncbi:serine hydrolase domain-containing protein [Hyphomonas sp. UBA4494]|uniref:serine hydrolase domain-containing protein n=1 Tax=Hyphomonas sp. UBA4494 TaxID=1946631 RepID=UPI0025BA7122|nr:serine hydrolase [Hyphomonas sp. UBA4494]
MTAFSQREPQFGDIVTAYAGKLMPDVQMHTFSHTHEIFPTRTIKAGDTVSALPYAATPLSDMPIQANGKSYDLFDYVSQNRLVGLLAIKDGHIVHEYYDQGIGPDTRWMSMSMAKSVSTTLVGAAIKDGFIDSVDDQLVKYLPELSGSGYDGVSIKHLLQMTSGVKWDDTHTVAESERRTMLDLQVGQKPGEIMKFMASLPRIAEPGTVWNYSTGETHVVGALVKAATGKWLSDYCSETMWSRLSMQADAAWWLESPDGLEVAGSGICANLHDYARLGLFALNGGVIDGESVVPEGWFTEATEPRMAGSDPLNYGYMWWPVPDRDGDFKEGAFSARGIFGQYIYVNPSRGIVLTVLSCRSKPKFSEAILDNDFFNAAVDALS